MEEWNKNDWQGRSQRQVEFTNKVISVCLIAFTILLLSHLVINLF